MLRGWDEPCIWKWNIQLSPFLEERQEVCIGNPGNACVPSEGSNPINYPIYTIEEDMGCCMLTRGNDCYSWFYHTWLMTYLWPSLSLCKLFRPHVLILYFDVSKFIPKNICLLLYMTFNPILACTHDFWPQTHIHQDVCIKPNSFGFFLVRVQTTWLFAFHMPWECSDSTLHYPFWSAI